MVPKNLSALNGFLTGALSGSAIFAESSDYWSLFAFFMFPQWLESVHQLLEKRHRTVTIPYFKNLLLSFSLGVITSAYLTNEVPLSGQFRSFVERVVGSVDTLKKK